MYSSYRMFGTDSALKLAQAQGEQAPVQRRSMQTGVVSGLEFMTPHAVSAVLDGRHMPYAAGPDAYRTDGGLLPGVAQGIVSATPRPEEYLQTISAGLSQPKGGELLNTRALMAVPTQHRMNLMALSASAMDRESQKSDLEHVLKATMRLRMQSFGFGAPYAAM